MSTPITHNTLLAIAGIRALRTCAIAEENLLPELCELLERTVGLYNYSDCMQCVKSVSGGRIPRRALHFEVSKDYMRYNSHIPLTVAELRNVEESTQLDFVEDVGDQEGDFVGQYTNFMAAKTAFANHYQGTEEDKLMAELVLECHLGVVDWNNDLLFREVMEEDESAVIINGIRYPKADNGKEAFSALKNLIQNMQQQAAEMLLQAEITLCSEEYNKLNEAIKKSYYSTFPKWIADNSVKYVGEIRQCAQFKVSDSYKVFENEGEAYEAAMNFVSTCVNELADKLVKMIIGHLI